MESRVSMSSDTEKRLCDLICESAAGEKEIEIYRKRMADAAGFEPYAAFLRINRYKSNSVTALDIENFLS